MPTDTVVSVHVELTPSEFYWAAVRATAHQLRKFLIILGIVSLLCLGAVLLAAAYPRPDVEWQQTIKGMTPLPVVIVLPLLFLFVVPLLSTKRFLADPRNSGGARFQFSESHVFVESSVGKTELNWSFFLRVLETPTCFFLYPSTSQAQVIPKRCLSNPSDKPILRELFRAHIPKHKLLQS